MTVRIRVLCDKKSIGRVSKKLLFKVEYKSISRKFKIQIQNFAPIIYKNTCLSTWMNVSPFILRLRYSDRKGERKQEVQYHINFLMQ